MRIYHLTFQEKAGQEVRSVWFPTKKAAQTFHDDLVNHVVDITWESVDIPTYNRITMTNFLNQQFNSHRSPRLALDDWRLEAHINAKTVHLLPVNPSSE
jgi:hypothetical protein|tara:strand:+ start:64 stop:360 length:297 start_codon:yes stop_codon:yes gene_type:complete